MTLAIRSDYCKFNLGEKKRIFFSLIILEKIEIIENQLLVIASIGFFFLMPNHL
jgi:hypothetical protein